MTTDAGGALERGPVGRWRTASGTAGALVGDEVVFAPDGTGRLFTHSVAFGAETLEFRWHMRGRARLWIRLTDADAEAEAGNADGDNADGDEDGVVVSMETRFHDTDAGRHVVLAETGRSGFWLLLDPLEWIGDD